MGSTTNSSAGDRTSMNNFNIHPLPETSFKPLTASQIDPFEYPPQLPSSYPNQTDSFANRSKSTEPFSYGLSEQSKH
jgi:hypothetical protein